MNWEAVDIALQFFDASDRGIILQHDNIQDRQALVGYIVTKLCKDSKGVVSSLNEVRCHNKSIRFALTQDFHKSFVFNKEVLFYIERG